MSFVCLFVCFRPFKAITIEREYAPIRSTHHFMEATFALFRVDGDLISL